jgi:hypothetical protein
MAQQEPDRSGRVVALVNRVVFASEFGEKWTEGGRRGWRVTVFFAEIEVEPDPSVIVRSLGLRYAGLVEPALETDL